MHIIRVGHLACFACFQLLQARQKRVEIDKALVGPNICAGSSFDHGHQHAFVKGGHHRLAVGVILVAGLPAVTVELRNGTSGLTGHAGSVHFDARCGRLISARQGIVFVVLSIRKDQHHLAGLALRIKRGHALLNRRPDGCALNRHGFGTDGIQKQLDRRQVQGQRRLHIGIASKHDQPGAVSVELAHHALNGAFGQV